MRTEPAATAPAFLSDPGTYRLAKPIGCKRYHVFKCRTDDVHSLCGAAYMRMIGGSLLSNNCGTIRAAATRMDEVTNRPVLDPDTPLEPMSGICPQCSKRFNRHAIAKEGV